MNELDLLKAVVRRLQALDIEYMISGSVALTFYGTPRMTRDIDIVIVLSAGDVDSFVAAFAADFYIDKATVLDALRHQSMFNIIHLETVYKIDFIIRKEQEYRTTEFSRRQKKQLEDLEIMVVSLDDLIISKLYWAKDSHSEMQMRDVRGLLQLSVDISYIEGWCSRLGISDMLVEVVNDRHG